MVSFEVYGAVVVVVVDDDDDPLELLHAARHIPATSTADTGHAHARFSIRCTP
jgi:hypothetical protein